MNADEKFIVLQALKLARACLDDQCYGDTAVETTAMIDHATKIMERNPRKKVKVKAK